MRNLLVPRATYLACTARCTRHPRNIDQLEAECRPVQGGTTVTVFPDGLSKYRSMGLHARGKCQFDRLCKCPIREVCGEAGDGAACQLVDTDC